jgi:hypothetical protein
MYFACRANKSRKAFVVAASLGAAAVLQYAFVHEAMAQSCVGGYYLHSYAFCVNPDKPPVYVHWDNSWFCAPQISACDGEQPSSSLQIQKIVELIKRFRAPRPDFPRGFRDEVCGPILLAASTEAVDATKAEAVRYVAKYSPNSVIRTVTIDVPREAPVGGILVSDSGSDGTFGSSAVLQCRLVISVTFTTPGPPTACVEWTPAGCAAPEHGYALASYAKMKSCGLADPPNPGGTISSVPLPYSTFVFVPRSAQPRSRPDGELICSTADGIPRKSADDIKMKLAKLAKNYTEIEDFYFPEVTRMNQNMRPSVCTKLPRCGWL